MTHFYILTLCRPYLFVCSSPPSDVDLGPNLLIAAANNVLLHLGKLEKEGRVRAIKPKSPKERQQEDETSSHTDDGDEGEVDDCKAEVAKAHAIAMERAEWRWKLIEQ